MRRTVALILLGAMAPVLADGLAGIRREAIAEFEDLVEWCGKKSLLRSRNQIYERILRLDPDHEKARYWLRYQRRGTEWVRAAPYREPVDRNPAAEAEYRTRREAIEARLEPRIMEVVERGGPGGAEALDLLLAIAPGSRRARALAGEVEWRGRWVLEETARAFERRAELQRIAGKALRDLPEPRADRPTEKERALGLRWTCAYVGHWWRFVATVPDPEEVRLSLRGADAAAALVAGAIADETRPLTAEGLRARDFGCYYLADRAEGMRFLAAHPSFTAADRRFAEPLSGTWVPKQPRHATWRESAEGRRDDVCRSAIETVLTLRYGSFDKGWLDEGFGIYLAHLLVGTRLTCFVAQTPYARDDASEARKMALIARMQAPDADWLALARGAGRPDLRFLATKGLNEMTADDVLWSHALAAYLLEGRPDGLSRFLAHCVKHNLDESLAEAYGTTVVEVEKRLLRWLDETG